MMNTIALYIDPETDDLAMSEQRTLALGKPQTTHAGIVITANRGELKECPLIGGEALRQLGRTDSGKWLTRLRKQLTAVGLKVNSLTVDNSNTITLTVQ